MRAPAITNPIESPTGPEKERLGWLVMWVLDGPEQGFIDNKGVDRCAVELADFLEKNGIHVGGQRLDYTRHPPPVIPIIGEK